MNDPAVHPAPTQPELVLLRPESEAIKAIAELIGKAAARKWLARKQAEAPNTPAPEVAR